MFKNFVSDLKYAAKAALSIVSGFVCLEYKDGDSGWTPVSEYSHSHLPDRPYYICAAFRNRRHIPLPVVLDWDKEFVVNRMQQWVVNHFIQNEAREACAYYVTEWNLLEAGCDKRPAHIAAKRGMTADDIRNASDDELLAIPSVGEKMLAHYRRVLG